MGTIADRLRAYASEMAFRAKGYEAYLPGSMLAADMEFLRSIADDLDADERVTREKFDEELDELRDEVRDLERKLEEQSK